VPRTAAAPPTDTRLCLAPTVGKSSSRPWGPLRDVCPARAYQRGHPRRSAVGPQPLRNAEVGVELEQLVKRLREAWSLPRFVAPAGAEPPAPLKSPPPPPVRQVGRRVIRGEGGRR
jgi:hypothetical protein